jgi:segregation and condensation protein B
MARKSQRQLYINEDMRDMENETIMTEDHSQDPWVLSPKFPSDTELLYPGEEALEMELDYFDDEKQEEKLWQARTGLNFDTLCAAIETIVFMSDKPMSINKIKSLVDEDMPLRIIHSAIERLQDEYEEKHHGLRLVEVADGYQFRTKATYSKYVQDLFKVNSLVLSPTALEVLAVVAYKQPIGKPEVDKIRGVDSGHIVRGLIDKRLVKVVGRSDEMGRPVLYGTTPEFLEVFNLASIDELPSESELEEVIDNNIGKIGDIKTIVQTGDKERFVFDDIDELDELAESIKTISADTDFTQAMRNEDKLKKSGASGDEKPRSAFDLLEEYVSRQTIICANQSAIESEMMSASADPIIVGDLESGPFNVPEVIEDDDDFQMIDLDTGLPVEEENTEIEATTEVETELLGEDLLGDSDEEAMELSKALDDAFERLTGESVESAEEIAESDKELSLQSDALESFDLDIDELTSKMVEDAKNLDLDISFIKDASPENSTES